MELYSHISQMRGGYEKFSAAGRADARHIESRAVPERYK